MSAYGGVRWVKHGNLLRQPIQTAQHVGFAGAAFGTLEQFRIGYKRHIQPVGIVQGIDLVGNGRRAILDQVDQYVGVQQVVHNSSLSCMGMGASRSASKAWAKSFRAPHFNQVISRPNDYFVDTFVSDTKPTTEIDSPPLLVYLFGPNPELEPVRATTWTLGFDWFSQSVSGLNLSTTYFNIHYDNRIIDVSNDIDYLDDEEIPGVIVSATSPYIQQTLAEIINLQPSLFDEIGRDPSETELIVDYRLRNEYKTVVDGIDFSLDYDFDTVLGAWSYLFQGTYLFGYKSIRRPSVGSWPRHAASTSV